MTRIPFRPSLWDPVISPTLKILYSQLFLTLPEPNSDFSGQTCIVTGANAGLAFEVAQHMVRLNATRVILAVRSVDRGEAARKKLEEATGRTGIVEVWPLDLSSFDSVKEFGSLAARKLDRLDCLVENAGIIATSYEAAEDYEATLTVNVLGTFLLAGSMLPLLKKTATQYNIQPRLTIVVSELHAFANFPERSNPEILASLNANTSSSDMARRYPISKLMALQLTQELAIRANRVDSQPTVIINSVNPGFCKSGLGRSKYLLSQTVRFFLDLLFARTTEMGSRAILFGATATQETNGKYLSDCRIEEWVLPSTIKSNLLLTISRPSAFVRSEEGREVQLKLWDEVVGILDRICAGIARNFSD
ncbi:related to enoyl-CoA hydratase/isomerase [Phialocephala subalpina]|uniref:Related to enoyl-CoA hydratase/isomerase n=1 Tax=Phialocephala subalpina TaxID=576137 RepID=A0A1L7XWI2_9HELO|nr:related to enoyl-CoA hydratase/isomerase [Phialocephala subalpina]